MPTLWSSNLQSEIALSTLEVEYVSLPQGTRELVAAKVLLKEMTQRMSFELDIKSKVAYTREDNIGTQYLATSKGPLIIPQAKHIGVKYHWL